MAFDKKARNQLAKMVASCRRKLSEDITDQLSGTYGLHPDGTVLPLDKLTYLSETQMAVARQLRDLLDHYICGGSGTHSDRYEAAYNRLVLEISFTALNRLAALRLCEERGLVVECVRKGMASEGFRVFEMLSGGALGSRYETYRVFLECLFDELAMDLGVLFDRSTPQSAVFPSERCLEEVLEVLNQPELVHLWSEDETIGWIYQYFNPPEERKAMREASQAPRNSRELAVRNQFFTPRYVVEFLTDNTLGRIWYEMRKGDTRLKEECRYLVRRPNEVFLQAGEKAPAQDDNGEDLSQEELLKRPVYIEHRPKKDPRDIKILDPACGSGHFLLYAFDLLETIYEEAWEDSDSPPSKTTGNTLRGDYKTLEDLRKAVPKLIIEHNLHGIDIDPRAVQIAALALWLRAQKTWKNLGLKPKERPRITKSNIVTAEPMPGEEDLKQEFIEGLKPRVLGQLVEVVFDKMKLAGEAGSLLKIEEEIHDVVAEAKRQWLERPRNEQATLFPELMKPRLEQKTIFDVMEVTDKDFWEQAEDRILAALKEYAEGIEDGDSLRRRLFAEDAARGFAFVDICRKRFDVVLMNPPFGESMPTTSSYISRTVPNWCKNLASAFIGRMITLLADNAKLGTVTDRTVLIKSSYEDFRISYVLNALTIGPLADLGWGVLDANVEVSAVVLSRTVSSARESLFIDCREEQAKASLLYDLINSDRVHPKKRWLMPRSFARLPNAAIAHDMPGFVIRWFNTYPLLKEGPAKTLQGHAIKMDWYGRLRWEISPALIGPASIWTNMYNGGSFSRFYLPLVEVVRWNHDGTFLKFHPSTRWSNAESQQKPGIGYGKRGEVLDAHIVPVGHVFTVEGLFVLPESIADAWYYLGILNSPLCSVILNYYCGQHKHAGYVDLLPVPEPDNSDKDKRRVSEIAREAWELKRHIDTGNEVSPFFVASWLHVFSDTNGRFDKLQKYVTAKSSSITRLVSELEDCVEMVYGLNESERAVIAEELQRTFNEDGKNEEKEEADGTGTVDVRYVAHDSVAYAVGVIFGRWDVRIAFDPSLAPKLPDPFDPLPVCPPGMLVGPDGLPAKPGGIVSEEWLRARPNANTLPPEGSVSNPTIPDSEYPLRISWNGILVDDPGLNGTNPHRDDIVRRVREVLELLWGDRAQEIEQEACEILGVRDLRDYFRKPSGFFQDHLKRYSKSRRKAPIYWPISTASGSYTVWLYYPRLTDQTIYAVVNEYLEPKIADVGSLLKRITDELPLATGREASRLRNELVSKTRFLKELQELRDELLRIAELPYKPDLNDGVIINAAPFHRLFRLNTWARETEKVWKKLEKGDYDWSHMAYTIWPERVREVCKRDLSIAIAHGLQDICEVEPNAPKKKGSRRRKISL